MRKTIVLILATFLYGAAFSQFQPSRLKVYLDCSQSTACKSDYIRTEMTMVDFVRDRFEADVHVLINTQSRATGGMQVQLYFIGQKSLYTLSDTLNYFNSPATVEDEQRKKLVQYLKLGLTRYVAKTKAGEDLTIAYNHKDQPNQRTKARKDPWNYWVFQLSAYGSLMGTENYKSQAFSGSFSANRETTKWKINAQYAMKKSIDSYLDDGIETKFERQSSDGIFDMGRVLSNHFAVGMEASYISSLYSNIKAGYKMRPKIELSILPYSKFNNQRIVLQYLNGPVYYQYHDTSVYFKMMDWQYQQSVYLITSFTKPWGNFNMGVFYSSYMNDFSRNSLTFNGGIGWKVCKGLNFGVWGNYGLVHDQIALRKGTASREEMLMRNKELKSNYNYDLGVMLTYRFGSLLNNMINPSFRGLNYSISM